jgi:hypothetical protein
VNYFHDIIFLSSYLHDALLDSKDIKLTKGTLTMPVERIGWEYWTRLQQNPKGTPGCMSLLTISGVKSLKWSRQRLPDRLDITKIFVGENQYLKDKADLIIYFRESKTTLRILGGYGLFDITLKDQELPHYGPNRAL